MLPLPYHVISPKQMKTHKSNAKNNFLTVNSNNKMNDRIYLKGST